MNDFEDRSEFPGIEARRFVTTCWTEVLLAGEQESPGARAALEHLCQLYWYPIYAFIRHQVNDPHEAEDHTQEFFRLLIEKNYLGAVDRERGRFRSFLLVAVKRFLINAHKHATRQKRGGGQTHLSLDLEQAEHHFQAELATQLSPEEIFDRRWARTVLDQATAQLQAEHATAGKMELFAVLGGFLTDESRFGDYSEAAKKLGLTPSAVAVAVHRLRQRFRQLLREAVKPTVADPAEVDEEMKHLVSLAAA
jgi:RNA polymerase sigma-70 factor (ECF subfamily)